MRPPALPLLLSGFMGTGKSTVGRVVADRASVPFFDLDELVEREAGRSIAQLFTERGEPAFRALEAARLEGLLASPGPFVVALGGGALLDTRRRRTVLERARVVTLTAPVATLLERTRGSARPLLAGSDVESRIRDLLDARAAAYSEAHGHVATEGKSPEAIADEVLAAWNERSLVVPLGARTYTVRFVSPSTDEIARSIEALAPTSFHVITDETVAALHGDALAKGSLSPRTRTVLPPGEQHKHLASVERALTAMIEAGADRAAVVVAHGGGVVTDIGGFVAATLLRGVRWIGVPTTLLAMVDASVGGKTGVDLGTAKNAVGAFHQPSRVIVDAAFTRTQKPRDFVSGLAEVVKSACVGDATLLDLLEREASGVAARDPELVDAIVSRSVAVKAAIVGRDERESGERALLNFGHTLGHALEAQGGFSRLIHGEAVSLGMVAMLRVGRKLGITDAGDEARVVALLARLGLPTDLSREPVAEALPFLGHDKKRHGSAVKAVFMESPGRALVRPIAIDELTARLASP